MRIGELHVGLRVMHPQHGAGVVKAITEQAAQVSFEQGTRSMEPSSLTVDTASCRVATETGVVPLDVLLREAAREAAHTIEQARQETVEQLGLRWRQGTLVLRPADGSLQAKELPLERFFHKIVMMRDNLRVLEQKLNANPALSDADKVELQQYITRCHGTMTSFNVLFKDKDGQFIGASA
jgi:hypothetical protein